MWCSSIWLTAAIFPFQLIGKNGRKKLATKDGDVVRCYFFWMYSGEACVCQHTKSIVQNINIQCVRYIETTEAYGVVHHTQCVCEHWTVKQI